MRIPKTLAIVLAGGQGSRLGALTQKRAKPALPVAGTYRLIDISLSNLAHSHINRVWLTQQYLPHSLNDHLSQGRPWDLDRNHGGSRRHPDLAGEAAGEGARRTETDRGADVHDRQLFGQQQVLGAFEAQPGEELHRWSVQGAGEQPGQVEGGVVDLLGDLLEPQRFGEPGAQQPGRGQRRRRPRIGFEPDRLIAHPISVTRQGSLRCGKLVQGVEIDQFDRRTSDVDQPVAVQLGQRPAERFGGGAQVGRDVLLRQR